jgi:hypothetical protein
VRLAIAAVVLAVSMRASADDFDPSQLSLLVFPETASWQEVAALPAADRAILPRSLGYEDCDTAERLLSDDHRRFFRAADVDADGAVDVIYAGPHPCREGDLSLVLYGPADDPNPRVDRLPYRLLRLQRGAAPRFTGFAPGCCDTSTSTLYLGAFRRPPDRTITVVRSLKIPSRAVATDQRWTGNRETTLRAEPVTIDEYDEDESAHQGAAVFGNVICRYLPGVRGRLVATFKDARRVRWGLVVVDPSSEVLAVHTPYGSVHVGWVRVGRR